MILAAGFGKRLRPLTEHMPKPLLPVAGRPMIEYGLRLLKYYGITEVFINVHHCADRIVETLGDGRQYGLKIVYSHEVHALDTGGGLKQFESQLCGAPFILMNGDILIDIDLGMLIDFHTQKKGMATLVLRESKEDLSLAVIEVDTKQRIQNMRGALSLSSGETEKLMFTGLQVIDPAVFDFIPSGCYYSIIDAYLEMIQSGQALMAYKTTDYWTDLGEIGRYQIANDALNSGERSLHYL